MQTNVAQPAIGAVSCGILGLLRGMGAEAGAVAGHSFGELTALSAAGAMSDRDLWSLAHARGDAIIREGGKDLGTMTAVSASEARIREVLGELGGITFANFNAPEQTVLAGSVEALTRAETALDGAGVSARPPAGGLCVSFRVRGPGQCATGPGDCRHGDGCAQGAGPFK